MDMDQGENDDGMDPGEAELQAPGEEEALPQGRGQGDRAAEAPRGVSLNRFAQSLACPAVPPAPPSEKHLKHKGKGKGGGKD